MTSLPVLLTLTLAAPALLGQPAAGSATPVAAGSPTKLATEFAAESAAPERSAAHDDRSDLVILNDGKEIECRVILEAEDYILTRRGSKKKQYRREDIAEIHSVERSLAQLFERYDALSSRGPAELAERALFCEQNELPSEARNLWIQVLTQDPVNEQAWNELGGVYTKRRGWRLKVRGRFYTVDQLRERVSDWKHAMEIPTAHFLLKTDIEPERAINIALNLERAYMTYYEVVGEALALQVFDEVPEVHVFKDPKDYPTPRFQGDEAWFSRGENTVFVNGASPAVANAAVFMLTHALVLNSFRRTIGGNGSIAPWTERALAEAFSYALQVEDGVATWEFGRPIMEYFRLPAADDKPLGMKRVITAGYGAFNNGTDARRYNAECHTLMFFLLHAEEGKYRQGLADYMRSSFKGQSAPTHLEKALGVKLKDLEPQWNAFVEATAAQ